MSGAGWGLKGRATGHVRYGEFVGCRMPLKRLSERDCYAYGAGDSFSRLKGLKVTWNRKTKSFSLCVSHFFDKLQIQ